MPVRSLFQLKPQGHRVMIRNIAFNFLMLPGLNIILSFLYKSLKKIGFIKSEFIFPFRGTIQVKFNESISFKMKTDGGDTIAARLHQDGVQAFETEMTKIFKELILYSNSFFDIGANTGYYSLLASTLNSRCIVHSFEPVPKIFENDGIEYYDKQT